MADAVGIEGLHSISGNCDLCGHVVDPSSQELNILGCTFSECTGQAYHQDCLEKYLKSIRLERNRKTGFKCPRGCGKGTLFKEACPGRIDKSHPIHPRSEESKKRRKAKLPEPAAPKPPPTKKEKAKQADNKENEAVKSKPAEKPTKTKLTQPGPTPVLSTRVAAAKKPEIPTKEKLAELRDQARREIGIMLQKDTGSAKLSDVYSAPRPVPASTSKPVASAWGKTNATNVLSTSNGSTGSPFIASHQLSLDSHGTPRTPSQPFPLRQTSTNANFQHTSIQHVNTQSQPDYSLHPQGSTTSVQSAQRSIIPPAPLSVSSSLPPPSPHSVLPVGMDYADPEDTPKLTKAQKKNLKRAERKKKQLASETASLQSSEQESLAQAEQESLLFDMFIQALVSHKVLYSLQQLQQLGFPKWACVAAVKRFGCQLEEAVSWLLEEEFEDADELLQSVANSCPAIDIEEELQELHELQMLSGLSAAVIQEAILENHGDVVKTLNALTDSTDATSLNGSQPSLSHAASCLSVQNGLFAYSVSNDSGDDGSELHGHFTQESNSLLDVLLEPIESSLTPTASALPSQHYHNHYMNGSSTMFSSDSLGRWSSNGNGLSMGPTTGSRLDLGRLTTGSGSEQQSDGCWHPLMGPSLLGLAPGGIVADSCGVGRSSHSSLSSSGLGTGLLTDLLSSHDTGSAQVPRVSLFQHAGEFKSLDSVNGHCDIWGGHSQQGHHRQGDAFSASGKTGAWMAGLLGELTPPTSIPQAALVAAATVPGDDHTGPATDEHEFNALMACLCSSMA